MSSLAFWSQVQVASFDASITAEESLASLTWRNGVYPGMLKLMPVHKPGKVILDFGCGPGHDTLNFLLHGAKHVYAADFSPRAIELVGYRLKAHGLEDRATLILIPPDEEWTPPSVDHVHAAGVIHHCADAVAVLRRLKGALKPKAEIRMMVYAKESWFYRSDPKGFAWAADQGAPIVNAYSRDEVRQLAADAGLTARYIGSYRHTEDRGPGLSSCWSLR